MKLGDLFEDQDVSDDLDIAGLTADSRKVKPGFLFAALKGVAQDGKAFIPMALKKGAAVILAGERVIPVMRC